MRQMIAELVLQPFPHSKHLFLSSLFSSAIIFLQLLIPPPFQPPRQIWMTGRHNSLNLFFFLEKVKESCIIKMLLLICGSVFPKYRIIFFTHYLLICIIYSYVLIFPLPGDRNLKHFDRETYRMFLPDSRQLREIRPSPLPYANTLQI